MGARKQAIARYQNSDAAKRATHRGKKGGNPRKRADTRPSSLSKSGGFRTYENGQKH